MIYMVLAYMVIWAAIFVFLLSMIQRQAHLQREIAALKELAQEREAGRCPELVEGR